MEDYECPECHRQMAVIFLDDGTAYDECQCGTTSELYPVVDWSDA